MLLSIIVPGQNVEAYIGKCLDSLLYQDINSSDYEIIVVNDGSTDRTKEIVEGYVSYLNEFRKLGVYPLSYKWVCAVHWYASSWNKLKYAAKTFFTNHPRIGYWYYSCTKRNP